MPALDTRSAIAWLRLHEPVLAAIGRSTSAAEETAAVEPALEALGTALDAALSRDPLALSRRLRDPQTAHLLAEILDELGPARRYRLLAWLGGSTLPEHAVLSAVLGSTDKGPRLRRAMHESNRRSLLARIFGPDRIDALLAACKTTRET